MLPSRRGLCLAGATLLASSGAICRARAQTAGWNIDTLLRGIARRRSGTTQFTETRHLAVLSQPVQSRGTLKFAAPDFLEMATTAPVPQTVTVRGDSLCIAAAQGPGCMQLSAHPQVASFITAIRAALSGDRAALQRDYDLALSGRPEQWTLSLTPRQAGGPIRSILIQGGAAIIEQIQILNSNNDQSVIAIRPTA